jgi:hypothetical protein
MIAPEAKRVKEIREERQISIQEASRIATCELLMHHLSRADNFAQLKPIIERLIMAQFGATS